MSEQIRTILTHVGDNGRSGMEERLLDRVDSVDDRGRPVFGAHLLWGTADGTAVVGSGPQPDMVVKPFFPGPGGHRFMLFTFLPEAQDSDDPGDAPLPGAQIEDPLPGLLDAFEAERPGMHTTDTIDYVYIVSGELVLELDDGEVPLGPGDCVIQRGTTHAWRNRSARPAVVAAVLIGADRH